MKCSICEEVKTNTKDFFGMHICLECVKACNDVIFAFNAPIEFERCKDEINGKCSDILHRVNCGSCGCYNEDIE